MLGSAQFELRALRQRSYGGLADCRLPELGHLCLGVRRVGVLGLTDGCLSYGASRSSRRQRLTSARVLDAG
jgi:hypothetical protein